MLQTLKAWARSLKEETMVLYFAMRDPRTPLAAKLVAGMVVAYALSPIDLIPDFIPVLGYLDDIILIPLGIALARRLIPPEILHEARSRAREMQARPRSNNMVAILIVLLWIVLAVWVAMLVYRTA